MILTVDGVEYTVPFGIARSALSNMRNFEGFITSTRFNNDGSFKPNYSFLNKIKGARLDATSIGKSMSIRMNDSDVSLT